MHKILELNPQIIVFIDAVRDKKNEGSLSVLDKREISSASISTHTSSINLIIDYLEKNCNADIYVIAISIKQTEFRRKILDKLKQVADNFVKNAYSILTDNSK